MFSRLFVVDLMSAGLRLVDLEAALSLENDGRPRVTNQQENPTETAYFRKPKALRSLRRPQEGPNVITRKKKKNDPKKLQANEKNAFASFHPSPTAGHQHLTVTPPRHATH